MVTEAARSAVRQEGGGEFELVVVHSGTERERLDGMIDGLPDAPCCLRIRRVDAQRAAGNRAAMCNVGVQEARGEWVRFVDDDDLLAPGALAAYRAHLAAAAGDGDGSGPSPIVWCDLVQETYGRRSGSRRPLRVPRLNSRIAARAGDRTEAMLMAHVGTATLFARRGLLVSSPYSEEYGAAEDAEWLWRTAIVDGAGMDFVPVILTRARQFGDNTGDTVGRAELLRLQRRAADAVASELRAAGRAADADRFEDALRRRDGPPGRIALRARATNACARSRHLTRLYLRYSGVRDAFGMF